MLLPQSQFGHGVRSGPGAARTILLFQIISAGPLNSLVWYVPSIRYSRGLGWCNHCGVEVTESSTNKQHHLSAALVRVLCTPLLQTYMFPTLSMSPASPLASRSTPLCEVGPQHLVMLLIFK